MSKSRHTPLPWKRSEFEPMEIIAPEPSVAEGHNVCSIRQDYSTPFNERKRLPEAQLNANAEFIVRACNAHDDLLTACKTAREELLMISCPAENQWVRKLVDILTAAKIKAEQ